MQYTRFLISIIVSAEYFIPLSYSKSCEGLFCHQLNSTQSNLSTYINQLMSSTTPESPVKHANKIAFPGTIEGNKLNKKCCYNGGTCFLGTFCICPKEYHGRNCEYEKWPQDCHGGILNGEWVVRGCSLCRCFSGELNCLNPAAECEPDLVSMNSVGSTLHHRGLTVIGLTLMIFVLCTV